MNNSKFEQHKEQKKIELLKILAKGCKKHPAYRAIRKKGGIKKFFKDY